MIYLLADFIIINSSYFLWLLWHKGQSNLRITHCLLIECTSSSGLIIFTAGHCLYKVSFGFPIGCSICPEDIMKP
jgi:hypothetical protein